MIRITDIAIDKLSTITVYANKIQDPRDQMFGNPFSAVDQMSTYRHADLWLTHRLISHTDYYNVLLTI